MIRLIACVGKNNELGKNGDLIWKIPEDLKFFRKETDGHFIFMGSKTFRSLPKLLPNRKHLVLSRTMQSTPDVKVFNSMQEFAEYFDYDFTKNDVYVIGGGELYNLILIHQPKNHPIEIILTEVDATCPDADTYFPNFNKKDYQAEDLGQFEYNGLKYKRVKYFKR